MGERGRAAYAPMGCEESPPSVWTHERPKGRRARALAMAQKRHRHVWVRWFRKDEVVRVRMKRQTLVGASGGW